MITINNTLSIVDTTVRTAAAIHPQVAAATLQDCELILLADSGEALVLNASARAHLAGHRGRRRYLRPRRSANHALCGGA